MGKQAAAGLKKEKEPEKRIERKKEIPNPWGRKSEEDKKQRKVLVRGERIKRIPEKCRKGSGAGKEAGI